jgi:hypothetical protein
MSGSNSTGSARQGLRRLALVCAVLGVALVGGVGLASATDAPLHDQVDNETEQPMDNETAEMARVRLVHASPEAPPVDVYVNDEAVVENLSFGESTDYLPVEEGKRDVQVTVAGNESGVVFETSLPVTPGNYTIAATGEVSEAGQQPFEPALLLDEAQAPSEDEALVRAVHLAPDAPAVDVTVNETGDVLFEDLSYRNATDYAAVPGGEYTLEIREAVPNELGDVVHTVNVSVENGTASTALAVGSLDVEAAPGNESFRVVVLEDAIAGAPVQPPAPEETPGEMTPGEMTPGEMTPGEMTPGEMTPGEMTPGEMTPGEMTPPGMGPGEELPQNETGP